MRNISDYIGKKIKGNDFEIWNYDDSLTIEEKKQGIPYSMICIEVNENTIIAMSTGEDSPRDFVNKNLDEYFELNPFMQPRFTNNSFLGEKNIFYMKKSNNQLDKKIVNQFSVYGFKENGKVTGTIKSKTIDSFIFETSFNLINQKLNSLKHKRLISLDLDETIRFQNDSFVKDYYNFKEKEIGSFIFNVNFLAEKNDFNIQYENSLSTFGFTFFELNKIIENVYLSNIQRITKNS